MLGPNQKSAFREWLQTVPRDKWTLIASSGMLNNYPGHTEIATSGDCAAVDCSFDVWYRFKEERDEILEMVANVTANALFLSGDTHYPGIFRLGENMLEISASPLGAFGNLPPGTALDAMNGGGDVLWIGDGEKLEHVFGEIEISNDLSITLSLNNVDRHGHSSKLHTLSVAFQ